MTIDLKSRYNPKLRAVHSFRKLEYVIDDFNNSFPEYELSKMIDTHEIIAPPEMEIEVSGTPKAKRIRVITLEVKSREKAKFESGPLEFINDI